MLKRQNGFTLIELVMIIVIIGILAAVAIPRFIGLQADARAGAVKGMYGAVKSSSAMVHATWLVRNVSPIVVEGSNVTIVNGYPAQAAGGIDNAVEFDAADFSFAAGVFSHADAATPANCSVTYVEPAALGAAPTITMDVSDCS